VGLASKVKAEATKLVTYPEIQTEVLRLALSLEFSIL